VDAREWTPPNKEREGRMVRIPKDQGNAN
jgi:hypothetical protein